MNAEIKTIMTMKYDGNHWVVYLNGHAVSKKIVDKGAAKVVFDVISYAVPRIAEAISEELEK